MSWLRSHHTDRARVWRQAFGFRCGFAFGIPRSVIHLIPDCRARNSKSALVETLIGYSGVYSRSRPICDRSPESQMSGDERKVELPRELKVRDQSDDAAQKPGQQYQPTNGVFLLSVALDAGVCSRDKI